MRIEFSRSVVGRRAQFLECMMHRRYIASIATPQIVQHSADQVPNRPRSLTGPWPWFWALVLALYERYLTARGSSVVLSG